MFKDLKYKAKKVEKLSIEEYLTKALKDTSLYATAAERLLKAIGEPEVIDTSKDPRLARIFRNKPIKRYKAFEDIYGAELIIEQIVKYLKHNAQGLEEAKQVLYLLGPVGGGKSSISEKLKKLMEQEPIYILCDKEGNMSPVFESPMGLFKDEEKVNKKFKIRTIMSPWARKRLEEYDGDYSQFTVIKTYPDQIRQVALCKTEPGDENNQDISTLVGKIDIRKLGDYPQNDPDAYSYTGALCMANQGILEFVEMFKSPLKVLNPLLTATQERNYKGTEAIGNIPFDGIILAHSNEAEWDQFKNNRQNEAFIDRICTIEVPYNLRLSEEIKIYENFIRNSEIRNAPIAPCTLDLLAKFNVLTRLETIEGMSMISKLKVYNGETAKDEDKNAKTYQEYKELASLKEGTTGFSTRLAFKILAQVFNFDSDEIAADPIHLFQVIQDTIIKERLSEDKQTLYTAYLEQYLKEEYKYKLQKMLQEAYVESYEEYGQALFNKYFIYADKWLNHEEYLDPETGEMYSKEDMNEWLEAIEKKAGGIANPKDFRYEFVNLNLRHRSKFKGEDMNWKEDSGIKDVIEAQIDIQNDDILLSLSKHGKGTKEDKVAYQRVVENLKEKGFTEKQIRRNIEWYSKVRTS